MSFGKFGARPRGMNNPVYWVSKHLQDQRRIAANVASTERFNEKWHRLNKIRDHLHEQFILPLDGKKVSEAEADSFHLLLCETNDRRKFVQENIETCSFSELSKYATGIKKLALLAFKLCRKYEIYNDIEDFSYNASEKVILLNGDVIYFVG